MVIHHKILRSHPIDKSSLKKNLKSSSEIILFNFPLLQKQFKLVHAVFSRHGGKSAPPYKSLNTAYNTNDSRVNVSSNLDLIKGIIKADKLIYMNQIHGTEIISLYERNLNNYDKIREADALITNIPGFALMVKHADCQAIILFDPVERVIANIHCGWRGNAEGIILKVVKRMESDFGCCASDIIAAIGPSLGPCCAEFISFKEIFPKEFRMFMQYDNYFNLWEISRMQLLKAGLSRDNIEIANICTKCNADLFYSYRAEKDTGRCATVVMLSI